MLMRTVIEATIAFLMRTVIEATATTTHTDYFPSEKQSSNKKAVTTPIHDITFLMRSVIEAITAHNNTN